MAIDELEKIFGERKALPTLEQRRLIREAAGLTISDMARAVGVTASAIYYYETGARKVSPKYRARYIAALERCAREVAGSE